MKNTIFELRKLKNLWLFYRSLYFSTYMWEDKRINYDFSNNDYLILEGFRARLSPRLHWCWRPVVWRPALESTSMSFTYVHSQHVTSLPHLNHISVRESKELGIRQWEVNGGFAVYDLRYYVVNFASCRRWTALSTVLSRSIDDWYVWDYYVISS